VPASPTPPQSSTRRDPIDVARAVNASWAVTRRRVESEAQPIATSQHPDPILVRLDRLERQVEQLVALLAERAP
jgi:hypothetical protein